MNGKFGRPPARAAGYEGRVTRRAFSLVELLVVISIVGVLMGIALPAIQSVRASAQKADCSNRLRQVAMGVAGYEGAFSHLPIGVRNRADPDLPHQTWLTQILPYVEQSALYEESLALYRADQSPRNHILMQMPVTLYGCPADRRTGSAHWTRGLKLVALTSYVGVCGLSREEPNGVLCYDQRIRLSEVSDGLSKTVLAGERPPSPDNWCGWWYAGMGQDGTGNPDMIMGVREINVRLLYGESCPVGPYHFTRGSFHEMCDAFHFWSPHAGGTHFAFCDGSVRLLSYDADAILPALATRADTRSPRNKPRRLAARHSATGLDLGRCAWVHPRTASECGADGSPFEGERRALRFLLPLPHANVKPDLKKRVACVVEGVSSAAACAVAA